LPKHAVAYQVLFATPDGMGTPDIAWGFCAEPAPLSSNNVVNDGCIYGAASLSARGPAIQAMILIAELSAKATARE